MKKRALHSKATVPPASASKYSPPLAAGAGLPQHNEATLKHNSKAPTKSMAHPPSEAATVAAAASIRDHRGFAALEALSSANYAELGSATDGHYAPSTLSKPQLLYSLIAGLFIHKSFFFCSRETQVCKASL